MKRLISVLLTVILLFAFCGNFIMISAANSGVVGECSWKLDGTVLTISGNGSTGNVGKLPWPTTITKVVVEEGVTEIGIHAFYQCSSLTDVVLPNSLKTIASSSFNWCSSLRKIYIPKNVSYIDEWAFDYCSGLQAVEVDPSNSYYTSVDGILFNKSKTIIIRYPSAKIGSFYAIPSTVTEIANNAFEGCSYLNGFSAPNNITRIGYNAFSYCGYSNNKSNYDNGVLYLGPYALIADWDKTVINCVLKDGTKLIANGCFSAWEDMETLVIPDGLTTIGDSSLAICYSLKSIRLPKSLKYVGQGAFSDCKALANVYYAGDINTRYNITFDSYNSIIQNGAFWHYDACQDMGLHDWKINSRTDSTCANEGNEQKTCNKCGENVTVAVEKKQHNFGKWKVTKESTCAAVGVQERKCSQCNYTEQSSIDAIENHNFSDWSDETAATCTQNGTQKRTCSICKKAETRSVDALDHVVKKFTNKDDDTSELVTIEGVCERCGETITKTISANGDTNSNDNLPTDTNANETSSKGAFTLSWKLIVCIIGGLIVVAAVIVTIVVLKKKKV